MPLVKVTTNVVLGDVAAENTAKALSAMTAELLGKPERYVLTILEPGKTLLFGCTNDPAAHVQFDSIGLPEDRTTEFSAALCRFLESSLGIPADRLYITFGNLERHLTGWDGRTF